MVNAPSVVGTELIDWKVTTLGVPWAITAPRSNTVGARWANMANF
jgi:hypothetical protein